MGPSRHLYTYRNPHAYPYGHGHRAAADGDAIYHPRACHGGRYPRSPYGYLHGDIHFPTADGYGDARPGNGYANAKPDAILHAVFDTVFFALGHCFGNADEHA